MVILGKREKESEKDIEKEIEIEKGCDEKEGSKTEKGEGENGSGAKRNFSLCLSLTEIEEDFGAMVGRRPPRRSKKRPKEAQTQINQLFPGLCLPEITPDLFKVNDEVETKKK